MTSCQIIMTWGAVTIVKLKILLIACAFLTLFCSGEYVKCGGRLTQKNGVIQSPNFPGPFMTPVFCEWVIQAPPKLKIVLYLTQYYLKGFFHVYEYDHYTNKDDYIGERKLATVNCEDEIWSIVAHKPFMVLRFAVQEMGNIHLRVLDHLIDVYGFNITYELVNKHEMDSKWTCSAFDCSYLGNCLANADFSEYKCHCFHDFFGDVCQYGPHCNPMIDKNMCQNNGSCRYLYGDYVNICQCAPGYYGSMCEQKINGVHPSACVVLDCEQTCITKTTDKAVCDCHPGYRLNTDNRTCSHVDRHIYNIECAIVNRTTVLNAKERQLLSNNLVMKLQQRGIFSVENVTIKQNTVSQLYITLYVESFQKEILNSILPETLRRIHDVNFDLNSLKISSAPDKNDKLFLVSASMRAELGTGLVALEDKGMTLSCVARGSNNIVFKWFKDGYLLDISFFQRRTQETLIPSSREGILRSVLTFDRVRPLDRGMFTCEASDAERSENKSFSVNVMTVPLVDLYPLSLSVVQGESTSIICMSPDDTAKNFTYTWYSNGLQIQSGRSDQIVEDLFPTGTRLYIQKVNKSENFTCTVENRAGVFSLTSYVFMQKASSVNMTCGRSYHKHVLWKKTAGNHFDKERCPSETGGYATRQCTCSGEICAWAEPNFAKCQSVYLVYEVYDKLEMLRLGYQQITIKYVYDRLCEFIIKNEKNLYSGDVELAVGILYELLRHLEQFPQLAAKDDKISVQSLVNLMDMMITAANHSSWEEKQDMKAAPYFLKICHIIARSIYHVLLMDSTSNISSSTLDVITYFLKTETNNINLTQAEELSTSLGTEEIEVIMFINKALKSMLSAKVQNPSINGDKPISDVHSVFPVQNNSTYLKNLMAYIPIQHIIPSYSSKYNQTLCVSWEFDERDPQFGRWTDSQCTVADTDNGKTICKCTLPGHFQVISIPTSALAIQIVRESYPGLPIFIACVINIVILGVMMLIHIVRRKWLMGDEHPIHFSFLLSVFLKSITFLICLKNVENSVMQSAGRIIVYFCFLVAYSCLFAESMQIFMSTGRKYQNGKKLYKYMLISWGIPLALTAFFGIASQIFPVSDNCLLICWTEHGQWHFYGFIIPIIALDIAIFIMLILALRSCLKFKDENRYTSKKTFFCTCLKSICILVLLNISSFLSTGIMNEEEDNEYIISYSVLTVILVIVVFMTRCLLDKEILAILKKQQSSSESASLKPMKRNSSSSFKAYMKPETVQQSLPGRDVIAKHYDQINRMKFTDERKRQLSFLLGSSQSGADLTAQNNEVRSNRSYSSCAPPDNGAADSGIFGSESERFLNGFDLSNSEPSFKQTTTVCVHSSCVQDGVIVPEGFEPFPELIQRNACKNIVLHTSKSNGIVRPKYESKDNEIKCDSNESTRMLIPGKKNEDNSSDEHETESL